MKNTLRKFGITLSAICILLCTTLALTGCGAEFAKKEYNSDKAIVISDRNITVSSESYDNNGEHFFTAKKFDGRTSLWKTSITTEKEVNITISLSISDGKAKVVYIDSKNTVTTLVECLPETSTEETITKNITLKSGQNKLKIVGYDCKNLKVRFSIEDEYLLN